MSVNKLRKCCTSNAVKLATSKLRIVQYDMINPWFDERSPGLAIQPNPYIPSNWSIMSSAPQPEYPSGARRHTIQGAQRMFEEPHKNKMSFLDFSSQQVLALFLAVI